MFLKIFYTFKTFKLLNHNFLRSYKYYIIMYSFIFPVLYRVVCTVPYGEKWYVKDFVMYERNQNHQSWKWLCYRKNEPGRFPFIGFIWKVSFFTLLGIWYWYMLYTRRPEGSTNQTYSSTFDFRISWILLERNCLFFSKSFLLLSAGPQKNRHEKGHTYFTV